MVVVGILGLSGGDPFDSFSGFVVPSSLSSSTVAEVDAGHVVSASW